MPYFRPNQMQEGTPHTEPREAVAEDSALKLDRVDPVASAAAAKEYKDPAYPYQFEHGEDRKAEIVNQVLLDADTDERTMKPYLARIQDVIKLYEQERDPKAVPFEGASNISAGDIPIAVENMHPRLFGAVLTDPLAHFRAENTPSVRNLPKIERLMQWAFRVDMPDLIDTLDEHVHSAIMTGTQTTWIRWDRIRNVYEDVEETADGGETVVRKTDLIERGALSNLNLEDFIVPITEGRDPHAMSHNIRRYYLTVQEVLELIRRNVFFADPDLVRTSVDEWMQKEPGEETQRLLSAGFTMPAIRNRMRLEILEWHGLDDPKDEGFRCECVYTVCRTLKLHLSGKYQPSPDGRRPFETTWLIPRKNFFYGIGIPEMIRHLARERDAIHNQRIDAGSVSIIPFGFYRAASGFKPDKIQLSPGSWIPLDDVERDVKFAQFSNPATVLASEEAMAQSQMEKLSIAGSFQLGRESEIFKSRATASGTQLIVGQGNIRFNLLGERVKRGVARNLSRLTTYYQRFLPPGTAERVLGDDGKQVFPQGLQRRDIRGKFHAYLTGDTETANKSLARQVSTFIYQTYMANPLVVRSPARMWEVSAQLLQSFSIEPRGIIGERPPDQLSFINAIREIIESIKQGFAPEVRAEDDLIGVITGLTSFTKTPDFAALAPARQTLATETIKLAQQLLQRKVMDAVQQQKQQQGGQQPGQPQGQAQPTASPIGVADEGDDDGAI